MPYFGLELRFFKLIFEVKKPQLFFCCCCNNRERKFDFFYAGGGKLWPSKPVSWGVKPPGQGRLPPGGVSTGQAGQGDNSGGLVHSVAYYE